MNKQKELFKDLQKAHRKLAEAVQLPETEINRDATIQRFEFTFELTWKLLNTLVRENGIEVYGPRNTLREAEKLGLIQDIDIWFDFLHSRNLTSHTYEEETAKAVYIKAKDFSNVMKEVIENIKNIPMEDSSLSDEGK